MRTKLFDFLNTSEIVRENIQSAFVVRLPFRLRIGGFYRHCLKFAGEHFEIVLRNLILLPETASPHKLPDELPELVKKSSLAEINTDAIVVVKNPRVNEDVLNKLNKQSLDRDAIVSHLGDGILKAIGALNRFIIAYATVAKSLMGVSGPLRLLQTEPSAGIMDINLYIHWNIAILWPIGRAFPDKVFHDMFKLMPPHEPPGMIVVRPPISDLTNAELTNIDKILSLQEESFYLELAFEAKSKYLHGDPKGGLLMAVAALEGAHAALVQQELISRLSQNGKKNLSKHLRSLPDEYLIRLGMSNCIHLTPYLMMDEAEMPPGLLIEKCCTGITIRNEIMHAKTNRQGQPKIRTRSSKDISDAYSAILKMYEYYIVAIEKRAETGATDT